MKRLVLLFCFLLLPLLSYALTIAEIEAVVYNCGGVEYSWHWNGVAPVCSDSTTAIKDICSLSTTAAVVTDPRTPTCFDQYLNTANHQRASFTRGAPYVPPAPPGPPAHCFDYQQNFTETGQDCGTVCENTCVTKCFDGGPPIESGTPFPEGYCFVGLTAKVGLHCPTDSVENQAGSCVILELPYSLPSTVSNDQIINYTPPLRYYNPNVGGDNITEVEGDTPVDPAALVLDGSPPSLQTDKVYGSKQSDGATIYQFHPNIYGTEQAYMKTSYSKQLMVTADCVWYYRKFHNNYAFNPATFTVSLSSQIELANRFPPIGFVPPAVCTSGLSGDTAGDTVAQLGGLIEAVNNTTAAVSANTGASASGFADLGAKIDSGFAGMTEAVDPNYLASGASVLGVQGDAAMNQYGLDLDQLVADQVDSFDPSTFLIAEEVTTEFWKIFPSPAECQPVTFGVSAEKSFTLSCTVFDRIRGFLAWLLPIFTIVTLWGIFMNSEGK